ncbi:hypothetical protein ACFLXE_00095 [Chloroflexota bacterium]
MVDAEAIVESMEKPRVKDVLRLTQFVAGKIDTFTVGLEGLDLKDPKKTGFAVVLTLLDKLDEEQLLEFGKLLLGDDGNDLTVEDLDLGWLSEVLAVWAEKINLPRLVKNAKRVAVAMRMDFPAA